MSFPLLSLPLQLPSPPFPLPSHPFRQSLSYMIIISVSRPPSSPSHPSSCVALAHGGSQGGSRDRRSSYTQPSLKLSAQSSTRRCTHELAAVRQATASGRARTQKGTPLSVLPAARPVLPVPGPRDLVAEVAIGGSMNSSLTQLETMVEGNAIISIAFETDGGVRREITENSQSRHQSGEDESNLPLLLVSRRS